MLVAQKDTITKITGIITPESIATLKNELGGAFTILKSTRFAKGQRYGYLVCVIPKETYRIVNAGPAWVYMAPANPGAYTATALAAGVSAAQHKKASHNTRKRRQRTSSISGHKKQERNFFSTASATMP